MRVHDGAPASVQRLPGGQSAACFRGHRRCRPLGQVANQTERQTLSSMTSSFPSFASFPEPEEDAPRRSKDKKERRKREKERREPREHRKERKRSRSRSSSREQSSKHDRGRGRRDRKRHRVKDDGQRWRPENDEQDKERQDRLLAEGQELESKPGSHPWFSDFKGDPKNITFGTLYKGDVPKFWRADREWRLVLRQVLEILMHFCRKTGPRSPSRL